MLFYHSQRQHGWHDGSSRRVSSAVVARGRAAAITRVSCSWCCCWEQSVAGNGCVENSRSRISCSVNVSGWVDVLATHTMSPILYFVTCNRRCFTFPLARSAVLCIVYAFGWLYFINWLCERLVLEMCGLLLTRGHDQIL